MKKHTRYFLFVALCVLFCNPIAITSQTLEASVDSTHAIRNDTLIPENAIAYYRLDPSKFEQSPFAMLPFALQMAEHMGFVDPEFHPIFDGILSLSTVGTVPHTLCILAFDADISPAFKVTDLSALLILETAENHRSFLNTLTTVLDHYGNIETRTQTQFMLNGTPAVRFTSDDWEDWQTVEWASFPDFFVVGLGHNSLKRWVDAQNSTQIKDQTHLTLHRDTVTTSRGQENPLIAEVWLNLDQLHMVMPEVLAQGKARDLLTTWKLDNARSWMLHIRQASEFLLADITWQRRSELPQTIAHRTLTLDHWPKNLTLPKPPGDYVIVIPIDFAAAMDRIIDGYRDTLNPDRIKTFDQDLIAYQQKYDRIYRLLWKSLHPYLIVSNHPAPPVPIPGATSIYFELNERRPSIRRMKTRVDAILSSFMTGDNPETLGDSIVRYDQTNDLYYLQLEKSGTLRTPAWGWVKPRYLVGGWGPPVVLTNRKWLEEK